MQLIAPWFFFFYFEFIIKGIIEFCWIPTWQAWHELMKIVSKILIYLYRIFFLNFSPSNPGDTLRNSLHGDISIGTLRMTVSNSSVDISTFPLKLSHRPSRDNPDRKRRDQGQLLARRARAPDPRKTALDTDVDPVVPQLRATRKQTLDLVPAILSSVAVSDEAKLLNNWFVRFKVKINVSHPGV